MAGPHEAAAVHEFDALVEPVHWGRSRYTVIRLPAGLVEDADRQGTRRVAGDIDGAAVNLAVTTAPVDGPFVYAGASVLRRIGVRAGDPVTCRLAPADPDDVPLPDDGRDARVAADLLAPWEALTPATRRRRLYAVDSAASAPTRAKRLTELVTGLRRG
ncbi:MAG: YdeI/OmpD-associated family protein [Actinobacteria bacterium]|nr:YdeI/OmpD-associated family protein [Actinomycetota bacterium]